MKINIKTSVLLCFIVLNSCASYPYNEVTIIDNSMNPEISSEQLELGNTRGDTGVCYYNNRDRPLRISSYYGHNNHKTVSWLFKNWGAPNKIEKSGGITYYTFDKKSKTALNYSKQYDEGEAPVKVGYKNGKIVYVSALKPNCPSNWKGPNYILRN